MSPLGLVEMTRKRTRESLEHLLCEPCPTCEGRGFVRSVETVCHEIYREVLRQSAPVRRCSELVMLAHPEVVERLLDEEAPVLAELETAGRQADPPADRGALRRRPVRRRCWHEAMSASRCGCRRRRRADEFRQRSRRQPRDVPSGCCSRPPRSGARVAVLPENFSLMARAAMPTGARMAEADGAGPVQEFLARTRASACGCGSSPARVPIAAARGERGCATACLVYDADGARVARYDKIHLFDVELPERAESLPRIRALGAGQQGGDRRYAGRHGWACRSAMTCAFRSCTGALQSRRAPSGSIVPAAFTVPTGEAHWELLLRARAIENLCYVVASGAGGRACERPPHLGPQPDRRPLGPRCSPSWPTGEGVVTAPIDLARRREARAQVSGARSIACC